MAFSIYKVPVERNAQSFVHLGVRKVSFLHSQMGGMRESASKQGRCKYQADPALGNLC